MATTGLLSGLGQYDTGAAMAGSPSIWGGGWHGAERSGSGPGGILDYTPATPSTTVRRGAVDVPMDLTMFEGANKYENYVRAWPDLLNHYLNKMPADDSSMAEWGQKHWEDLGQYETDAAMAEKGKTPMEAWRARGMWGDAPLSRVELGPGRFQASRYLPSMPEAFDPRAGVTETQYSAGVPMPDVEGYKYAYRPYEWSRELGGYQELAYDEYDISKYPYYPYLPTGGQAAGAERILAGVRLVPK